MRNDFSIDELIEQLKADAEEVVQSAFKSFFVGFQQGKSMDTSSSQISNKTTITLAFGGADEG